MLTVEHVKLRRRKDKSGARVAEVVPLCGVPRARALELADVVLDIVRAHEGEPRAALEEALDELPVEAAEVRFGRGLKKLALDACAFDVDSPLPPEELRAEVFAAAARARAAGRFAREVVLADAAVRHGASADVVERALYADLGAAHAVRGFDVTSAEELVARYAIGELQAVVLRATRLVVDVAGTPQELRALLRALKLHQLLFEVEHNGIEGEQGALRLVVEGPMGLFQQSTRYGLKLALLLPAIFACARARVEATVRLHKQGGAETLVIDGPPAFRPASPALPVPDVVRDLLADLESSPSPWRPRPALDVIHLPGAGAIIPDLELVHDETGEVVSVEVLGFWSRAAVWKRVELVEKGLPVRVVFCASERLRVSEEALPAESTSALVVFKGALRASRVREAADRVTGR